MTRPQPAPALPAAAAGVLAAAAGAAAGHLAAGLTDPAASPVIAVGSTVIDATPTAVKDWAVATLGAHDKPVLLAGVVLVTLLLAGLAGRLTRRSRTAGAGLLLLLVALATAAALTRPVARPVDVVPGLVTAATGVGVLLALTRRLTTSDGTDGSGPTRRGVLLGSGAVAVAALAAATAGQWLAGAGARVAAVRLPRPARPLPPLPAGLEQRFPGISPFRTPVGQFYRVDTNLTVPAVDPGGWRLVVDGAVHRRLELRLDDLLAMPLVEHDVTLTCVSNQVGGQYVGSTRWLGVPLQHLLDRAGVRAGPDMLLSTAVDGFTISTPLDVATDGRPTLVAVGMDGRPLPPEHGFPARLVTPGVYGFVGATKWLTRLTLTTYDEHTAYWTGRGWATRAPIKISSRIDTPAPLSSIAAGPTVVGGVAWAQEHGVAGVEVSIDGGPWQPARLGPDAGIDYWRQWYLPWRATPGRHDLAVRARSRDGLVQTAVRAAPFPDGSSGIQHVVITVT